MVSLIRRKTDAPPGRLMRQPIQSARSVRALRASATAIDLARMDRAQAHQLQAVRQSWQGRAWHYRREVGELRYAVAFLGNAARRMMFYPAVYMPGELIPVKIEDSDLKQHAAIAHDALDRIGDVGGRAGLAKDQMENFEVTGECYLVSRIDDGDGLSREVWEIRSQSEVQTSEDGKIIIRDMPGQTAGSALWSSRDSSSYVMQPDDFFARMWWPDPEFRRLADSPIRSAESILEELIILGKDVRASGVSRLANNGILLMPDSLSVVSNTPDEGVDPEDDEFVTELMEAAAEAIRDPGSAAAAIPIVARGPADALDKVKFLTMPRPEADNSNKRTEALRRLATSIDLPSEILTGIGDMNHWSAWAVDDSTFRHHIEPLVQGDVDAWTAAYYRRYLLAADVPPEAVARMVVWYDPTELLTKPDRSADAKVAFDSHALSAEALRKHLGFPEEDAPTDEELVTRLLFQSRTLDPAIAKELIVLLDPRLKGALETPAPIPVVGPIAAPPDGTPAETPTNPNGPSPAETGPPPETEAAADMRRRVEELHRERATAGHPAEMRARISEIRAAQSQEINLLQAMLASARTTPDWAYELSRRLAERDQQLRESLRVACEAAVKRTLERAGAKVITKVRQTDSVAAAGIKNTPAWAIPGRLGPVLVAALGLSEDELLKDELTDLRKTWDRYVTSGQTQALRDAARLVGMDVNTAFAQLDGRLRADRDAGWNYLRNALDRNTRAGLVADPSKLLDTGQLVPTSGVRAAIAIAGGYNTNVASGLDPETHRPADPKEHFGQLGTGTTVKTFLESNGAKVERYRWVHGMAIVEFPPHAALDGFEFDEWDDPRLLSGAFPGDLHPGDHSGCHCDVALVWVPPIEVQAAVEPTAGPAWSASMPPDRASEFAAGSVVEQTLYHGTTADISGIVRDGFDDGLIGTGSGNRGWAGEGLYFTERPSYAATYAFTSDTGRVLSVRTKVSNPWVSTTGSPNPDDPFAFAQTLKGLDQAEKSKAIRAEAERRGHDSVVVYAKDGKINEMVAFRKDQVVVTGDFDPWEADALG